MLVLTRKVNEDVEITTPTGEVVTVKVCGLAGGKVKLGFSAPANVRILRTEVRLKGESSVTDSNPDRGAAGVGDGGAEDDSYARVGDAEPGGVAECVDAVSLRYIAGSGLATDFDSDTSSDTDNDTDGNTRETFDGSPGYE